MFKDTHKVLNLIGSTAIILTCIPAFAEKPKEPHNYGEIQKETSKVLKTEEHIPGQYIVVWLMRRIV